MVGKRAVFEPKGRVFKVEESLGNLPYSVHWVSLDGRLSATHWATYDGAKGQYDHLVKLGRQPSISLSLSGITPVEQTPSAEGGTP